MQYCLLQDSAVVSQHERSEIDFNELTTAHLGRMPELMLKRQGVSVTLKSWGLEVCEAMRGICQLLDDGMEGQPYQTALDEQVAAFQDPDLTPSARMLAEMRQRDEGFFAFALRKSLQHRDYFLQQQLSDNLLKQYREYADKSIREQRGIEASDSQDFDTYLADYFNQQ